MFWIDSTPCRGAVCSGSSGMQCQGEAFTEQQLAILALMTVGRISANELSLPMISQTANERSNRRVRESEVGEPSATGPRN